MKIFLPLAAVCLLAGCRTFSVVSDMDSTNYTSVPYIQTIQKAGHIGHTDRAQRKRDLYACGVGPNAALDSEDWGLNGGPPGTTATQVRERKDKIESCMKSKGYVLFDFAECGPLKALTGLCN